MEGEPTEVSLKQEETSKPERNGRPKTPKSYWYRYHQEKTREELRKARKTSNPAKERVKPRPRSTGSATDSSDAKPKKENEEVEKEDSEKVQNEPPKNAVASTNAQNNANKSNGNFINHLFTILDGEYFGLRMALKKRGWNELPNYMNKNSEMSLDALENLVFRSLRSTRVPAFIWTNSKDLVRSLHRNQIVSKFTTSVFTTKVGLCKCLQDVHWALSDPCFGQFGYTGQEEFFPRCYIIGGSEDKEPFIRDYMATAYISTLKWVVEKYHPGPIGSGIESPEGDVPYRLVREAIGRVKDLIHRWDDVDSAFGDGVQHSYGPDSMGQSEFLSSFYRLVHGDGALELTDEENILKTYNECYDLIERVEALWPASKSDGITNTWIVKPGARSRGRGILVLNKLDSIMQFCKPVSNIIQQDESRYVVQKYLETPLLIHGYKFDIRQWFVITDWSPLTVWMYDECYLRFCTQPFSLSNLHESVHLNNFAVQKNYPMECPEDLPLPKDKMWDSETFKQYLDSCGLFTAWEDTVLPGMRDIFVATMLAAQENAEPRANAFEVYGVDYMLTADCKPWIIEINSSPDLNHSTSVTTRLVPQMFEDLVKVIIDRRVDKNCDTGGYQLVYRQQPAVTPFSSLTLDLKVVGRRIPPVYPTNPQNPPQNPNAGLSSQKLAFGARHSLPPSPWSRVLIMAAASAQSMGSNTSPPSSSAVSKQNKNVGTGREAELMNKSRLSNFGQILVGRKKPMLSFAKAFQIDGTEAERRMSLQAFCTPRRGQRSASVAPATSSMSIRKPSQSSAPSGMKRDAQQQSTSPEERLQRLAILATPKRVRKPLVFAGQSPVSLSSGTSTAKFRSSVLTGGAPGRSRTSSNDNWRKNLAA